MFTGLIESIGTVKALNQIKEITNDPWNSSIHLIIQDASKVLTDCQIGDSLSINGTCLTVLEFDSNQFTVGLSPETLRRTNLGILKVSDQVNLERAMRADTRFGGHFVQGHVDRTAKIESIEKDGDSLRMKFDLGNPSSDHEGLPITSLLIPKGYITIDGISLTLCSVPSINSSSFEIMLIQHTQNHVTLSKKSIGDLVNLEFDCLTKSIARTLVGSMSTMIDAAVAKALLSQKSLDSK
ncbi:hypothetical protein DFH28DRAFT_1053281 [Melampsora americana]|nr:hypothetical protein DFH28DRAFT_1053281 [Melampsora americana]